MIRQVREVNMSKGIVYNIRKWLSDLIKPKCSASDLFNDLDNPYDESVYIGVHNGEKENVVKYKYPPSDMFNDGLTSDNDSNSYDNYNNVTPEENLNRIMSEAFPNGLHNVTEQSNIEQISERISKQATESMQSSYHFGSAIFLASFIEMVANDYELEDMIDVFDEMIDNTEGLSELVDVILMDIED